MVQEPNAHLQMGCSKHAACPTIVFERQSAKHTCRLLSQKHRVSAVQPCAVEYAFWQVFTQGGESMTSNAHMLCRAQLFASSRVHVLTQSRALLSHMHSLSVLQA